MNRHEVTYWGGIKNPKTEDINDKYIEDCISKMQEPKKKNSIKNWLKIIGLTALITTGFVFLLFIIGLVFYLVVSHTHESVGLIVPCIMFVGVVFVAVKKYVEGK